jgi:hypothetical protein
MAAITTLDAQGNRIPRLEPNGVLFAFPCANMVLKTLIWLLPAYRLPLQALPSNVLRLDCLSSDLCPLSGGYT